MKTWWPFCMVMRHLSWLVFLCSEKDTNSSSELGMGSSFTTVKKEVKVLVYKLTMTTPFISSQRHNIRRRGKRWVMPICSRLPPFIIIVMILNIKFHLKKWFAHITVLSENGKNIHWPFSKDIKKIMSSRRNTYLSSTENRQNSQKHNECQSWDKYHWPNLLCIKNVNQ